MEVRQYHLWFIKHVIMKKIAVILAFAAALLTMAPASAQQAKKKKIINRYSMRLIPQDDGSYKIDSKTLNLLAGEEPEGLYEPYKNVPLIPSSKVEDVSFKEIVYKTYPDRELKLYIAPAVGAKALTPVVCFIHGGGWRAGNPGSFRKHAMYVAKYAGFAGVSIGYSLAGQKGANISVTMRDLHDAVQYLREHATEYNLDMKHLAFAGSSAGGHLAAMMALTEPDAKVLSGWSGVYDMEPHLEYWAGGQNHEVVKYMFGGKSRKIQPYSPVYNIPVDRQIAVQLFQGTGDSSVHHSQAESFRDALEEAGQKTVECNIYPYYAHGLTGSSDKGRECFAKFIQFTKEHIYD